MSKPEFTLCTFKMFMFYTLCHDLIRYHPTFLHLKVGGWRDLKKFPSNDLLLMSRPQRGLLHLESFISGRCIQQLDFHSAVASFWDLDLALLQFLGGCYLPVNVAI